MQFHPVLSGSRIPDLSFRPRSAAFIQVAISDSFLFELMLVCWCRCARFAETDLDAPLPAAVQEAESEARFDMSGRGVDVKYVQCQFILCAMTPKPMYSIACFGRAYSLDTPAHENQHFS